MPPPVFRYEFPADFYRSVQIPEVFPKDFSGESSFSGRARNGPRHRDPSGPHPDYRENSGNAGKGRENLLGKQWLPAGHGAGTSRKKTGNIGYGFLTGSCLREGTVATTYFHDHHNLFVAGNCPEDMLLAVKRIQELQGGISDSERRRDPF